jgi:hypothetical protein
MTCVLLMFTTCVLMLHSISVGSLDVFSNGSTVLINLTIDISFSLIGCPEGIHSVLSVGCLCRCFGSDRTPGVAPRGVFRSRTVSTTVAKWFVPIARGTMDKICRFGPLRSA